MFDFTKTIINGVKVWCKSEIDRMRTALEPLIAKAQKTADGAAKSVKTLTSNVQTEMDMLYQTVEAVQSTANTAKNTANSAQSTANTAKTTAESAQSTANTAKNTANSAQSTANTAKNTANSAQSTANTAKNTAESAQSTANTAKNTADGAVKKSGDTMTGELTLPSASFDPGTGFAGTMRIITNSSSSPQIMVAPPTSSMSDGNTRVLQLVANAGTYGVRVAGVAEPINDRDAVNKKYADEIKNTAESAQKAAENSISEERVNELIDAKLGVIENGSY